MTDFFISYTGADKAWAEWIAWTLEAAKFSVVIQAWDFRPGGNFVVEMQRAAAGSDRTLAVLSPDYLRSLYGMAEWAAAFAADPDGAKGKLVPVKVREVALEGLLSPIIHVNLVGLGEAAAREALLSGLVPGRVRPESVRFPGTHLFPGPAPSPPDPDQARAALADLPLEEVPRPGPLPIGSRMPLSPNPLFVGREEDLKTLARQLKAGETSAVGQVEIAAATGLGGMGKTQLASEFVHRYGRFFAGGAFWMSFADAGSVSAEVAACGRSLGLHSSFEALTLEQQVRLVQDAWQGPLPRLLVFDNCEEEGLLHQWRPTSGGTRVLLTSRRPEWDPALGIQTVPLTTLPRPASIELLRRFRPDLSESEPALGGIARELGDLPLALHLAGSFLQTYRASPYGQPATYLDSLRRTDLLDHPSLQGRGAGILPTGHDGHVGRTFALSFERLDSAHETDALAIDFLARAAWFALGEPIPRSLLLKTVHVDSGDLIKGLLAEDALRRLTDLGLMEANDQGDFLMHRLVSAWALSLVNSVEARAAVEETVLEEARRLNKLRNPAPLLAWQPHLRSITDRALKREDRMAARLCDELGLYLWHAGDYSEAQPYLERAVSFHMEVSGPEHQDTARSLNVLGVLFNNLQAFERARPYIEHALAIREKRLGSEHPDVAESLNDLGALIQGQGDFGGARLYHERALAIREKVLGPEHPDTTLSLGNLGGVLQDQGDYGAARSYLERALAVREKVLGPEHPDTATSLNNLGSLLQRQGDQEAARPYHERALAIVEKVLGPEHPATAASLNNLGFLLKEQGDQKTARLYYERALAIVEKVLGPEHPDTSTSLNNLGGLLREQGDQETARLYYERALAIVEKVLGPEHPDTATSLNNLGSLLREQGDQETARLYYERALAIVEKVLGPEHPDTATSLNNLGSLLQEQGDHKAAHPYYERALAIREKVLGPEHPNTAASLNNLGFLLNQQGDQETARLYYKRALAIREKVLGPEHPDTATSLNNLGGLLQEQGDHKAARPYMERALAILEKVRGPKHPDTAKSLMNLGSVYFNQGNFPRARLFLERALKAFTACFGPDHPYTKEARKRFNSLPGVRQQTKQRSPKGH